MRRSVCWAVLVGAVALAAGCSSESPPTPAASAPSTASTGTTSTATPTATSTRAPATLQAALLGAADLPQGWLVFPDRPTGTATVPSRATSFDPACAAFLELVKDPPNPLPANQAQIEFSGGENFKPPSVVESIEAFPSGAAAVAELARQRETVATCPTVTYTLDDRTSPVTVRKEAPPTLPVPALGIRLTAESGELKGYDARVVTMQVGDVVISMTLLKATPDQMTSLTNAAAAKAAKALGSG